MRQADTSARGRGRLLGPSAVPRLRLLPRVPTLDPLDPVRGLVEPLTRERQLVNVIGEHEHPRERLVPLIAGLVHQVAVGLRERRQRIHAGQQIRSSAIEGAQSFSTMINSHW